MTIQLIRPRLIANLGNSQLAGRFVELVGGTVSMGSGIALLVWSQLGMVPADVLHVAVSHSFGWTFGSSIVVCQLVLAMSFIPLKIRPGLATVLAFVIPAAVADALLSTMPTVKDLALSGEAGLLIRAPAFLIGGLLFCVGVAAYLRTDLGPLPRDGLMLAVAGTRRGIKHAQPRRLALARIAIDTASVAGGVTMLGPATAVHVGALSPGTVLMSAGSGPLIAYLRRMSARDEAEQPGDTRRSAAKPSR